MDVCRLWLPPPQCPSQLSMVGDMLKLWPIQYENADGSQLARVLGCFSESYLAQLPPPSKSDPWPEHPLPSNWRYLFQHQVAKILQWKHKRVSGFPAHINEALKIIVWPDNAVESGSKRGYKPKIGEGTEAFSKKGAAAVEKTNGAKWEPTRERPGNRNSIAKKAKIDGNNAASIRSISAATEDQGTKQEGLS